MKIPQIFATAVIGMGLSAGAFAQTAGQHMKDAGSATKDAAKDAGHAAKEAGKGVGKGAKTVGNKVKDGTHDAAQKVADKTDDKATDETADSVKDRE
jgi:hypothetical protein